MTCWLKWELNLNDLLQIEQVNGFTVMMFRLFKFRSVPKEDSLESCPSELSIVCSILWQRKPIFPEPILHLRTNSMTRACFVGTGFYVNNLCTLSSRGLDATTPFKNIFFTLLQLFTGPMFLLDCRDRE